MLSSRFRARKSCVCSNFFALASAHSAGLISLYLSSRGMHNNHLMGLMGWRFWN